MSNPSEDNDDLLDEYDFSEGTRGKYAERYAQGTNVVLLEPDVAKVFPDSDAVNQALREFITLRAGKQSTP
jgi:hypothetical protein